MLTTVKVSEKDTEAVQTPLSFVFLNCGIINTAILPEDELQQLVKDLAF